MTRQSRLAPLAVVCFTLLATTLALPGGAARAQGSADVGLVQRVQAALATVAVLAVRGEHAVVSGEMGAGAGGVRALSGNLSAGPISASDRAAECGAGRSLVRETQGSAPATAAVALIVRAAGQGISSRDLLLNVVKQLGHICGGVRETVHAPDATGTGATP